MQPVISFNMVLSRDHVKGIMLTGIVKRQRAEGQAFDEEWIAIAGEDADLYSFKRQINGESESRIGWESSTRFGVGRESPLTAICSSYGQLFVGAADGSVVFGNNSIQCNRAAITGIKSIGKDSLIISSADGTVKLWSMEGQLRSTLLQCPEIVKGIDVLLGWLDLLVVISGDNIYLKPLVGPGLIALDCFTPQIGLLSSVAVTDEFLIVGSADFSRVVFYKIHDLVRAVSGKPRIFRSIPFPGASALSWNPELRLLAIGGFEKLEILNRHGQLISSYSPASSPSPLLMITEDNAREVLLKSSGWIRGSVMDIAWGSRNGEIACATGGSRNVCVFKIPSVVKRHGLWVLEIIRAKEVRVRPLGGEVLDLPLPNGLNVVDACISDDTLFVLERSQLSWLVLKLPGTPQERRVLSLKSPGRFILRNAFGVLVVLEDNSVLVMDNDGKRKNDCQTYTMGGLVAIRDTELTWNDRFIAQLTGPREVSLLARTNRPTWSVQHPTDILQISLLRDLFILLDDKDEIWCYSVDSSARLASLVDSFVVSPAGLVYLANECVTVILYPEAALSMSRAWLSKTTIDLGRIPGSFRGSLLSAESGIIEVLKSDGTMAELGVTPLLEAITQSLSDAGSLGRLCIRFPCDDLAAITVAAGIMSRNLTVCIRAGVLLKDLGLLSLLNKIKSAADSAVKREALWLVLAGQDEAAVRHVKDSGIVFKAIKLSIKLHRWEEALQAAQAEHLTTVLGYREKYLDETGSQEVFQSFVDAKEAHGPIDWEVFKAEVARGKAVGWRN